MAMTATIASNPTSTAVVNQPVTMILTISNSGSSVVNMTSVMPYALSTDGVKSVINTGLSFGKVNFGPNANLAVPPSGSLVLSFPVTFFAPSSGVLSDVVQTYSIGATCYSDDGSVFIPTADTITVNNFTEYPEAQQ
jgi:hypothetical protein